MKATKVFIIFALALASKLALVESIRNGAFVIDPALSPNPHVAQIRSIKGTVKRNSTGAIITSRYVMVIKDAIFQSPSTNFCYLGKFIYNDRTNVVYFDTFVFDRALGLGKTRTSIIMSPSIQKATLPVLGQNYFDANATIIGYGPVSETQPRPYSNRNSATNLKIDYNSRHLPTATPDMMVILKGTGPYCMDYKDWGSLVWAPFNGAYALVAMIFGAEGNASCATNPSNFYGWRITKWEKWIKNVTANT